MVVNNNTIDRSGRIHITITSLIIVIHIQYTYFIPHLYDFKKRPKLTSYACAPGTSHVNVGTYFDSNN